MLKLEYHLVVSRNDTPAQVSLLRAFVSRCLQLYKVSLSVNISLPVSDRRPGDDAAMLGAMALIRLHEFAEKHALLQCITILECLLSHSKHNYDALLTLTRLYMQAGVGTLAADLYSRLSIKNMQHATVSWILYNRISTIHPYEPSRTISTQSPSHMLKNLSYAIDWHMSAEEYNSIAIDRMIECGQYTMLFDTLKIGGWIKNGFGKFMFVVESHRIGRFSQFSQIKDYSSLLGNRFASIYFSPLIQISQVVSPPKPRILEMSPHSQIMRRWASKDSWSTSRQDRGPMWVCPAPAVRSLLILLLSTPGSAHKSAWLNCGNS